MPIWFHGRLPPFFPQRVLINMVDIQIQDKGNGLVVAYLDRDATDVAELFVQHDQLLQFYIVDTKDQRVKRALRRFCGPPVTLYDASGRRTLKPPGDEQCAATNVLDVKHRVRHGEERACRA